MGKGGIEPCTPVGIASIAGEANGAHTHTAYTKKAYQRAHYQANKLRPHIIARQGMICAKCGKELTLGRDCCLDFIVPFIAGGQPIGDNLELLCRPCNSSKSGR